MKRTFVFVGDSHQLNRYGFCPQLRSQQSTSCGGRRPDTVHLVQAPPVRVDPQGIRNYLLGLGDVPT